MNRRQKTEREKLLKQVEWCKEVALDHYLNGRMQKGREWETEVLRLHEQIMMLHPRYKEVKARRERAWVPAAIK